MMNWTTLGSSFATLMFLRSTIPSLLPPEISALLKRLFVKFIFQVDKIIKIIVDEYDLTRHRNEIYDNFHFYISSKCYNSSRVMTMSKAKNSQAITFTIAINQDFEETFEDFKVKWSHRCVDKIFNGTTYKCNYLELTFHEKYRDRVQSEYLPRLMEEAARIKFNFREKKIWTNSDIYSLNAWNPIPYSHPSTFETLAMDPKLKKEIQDDLLNFRNQRLYYTRIGRAWKRGYLLYGPPGTGKTSLISAIANFLDYDIYDLELGTVQCNSQLRRLLVSTPSKSVIVVEDVDCTVDLSNRKKAKAQSQIDAQAGVTVQGKKRKAESAISLSGVLNFVDGLWSSCGGERLIIFTTNHKENLDAALLRPGRMDKHIHLSYCEFSAFKILVKNYLNIEEHELMSEVEQILPSVLITPADVAETLLTFQDDPDSAMKNVVHKLKKRRVRKENLNVVGKPQVQKEDLNVVEKVVVELTT